VAAKEGAMVLLALAACAACCAAIWAALIVLGTGRAAEAAPPRRTRTVTTREEDLVRPAVDPSGEPIWLETDELFWHEIVCWPGRQRPDADRDRAAG
jgi:hypothetical protein